jgi:hypothetical protein
LGLCATVGYRGLCGFQCDCATVVWKTMRKRLVQRDDPLNSEGPMDEEEQLAVLRDFENLHVCLLLKAPFLRHRLNVPTNQYCHEAAEVTRAM